MLRAHSKRPAKTVRANPYPRLPGRVTVGAMLRFLRRFRPHIIGSAIVVFLVVAVQVGWMDQFIAWLAQVQGKLN
jgi:hypothetical protein